VLRAKMQGGANNWDVVQVESEELLIGADEGLFEPMDWAAIGGRDAYIPEAVNDHGVGAILYSFIMAYDRARMAQGPASWADFLDTARFPGRRGLRKGPKTTLEIALMADGVPPGQVYQLLGTAAGVDRAFRRLDSVEADLAWFERGLDEDDVDILAWAMGAAPVPENFAGPLLKALQRLDYVTI
jgi:putative spermidine/putrescine transport system substrate-binding protein